MYTMIFLYYVSLLVTLLAFLTLLALWLRDLWTQHHRTQSTYASFLWKPEHRENVRR